MCYATSKLANVLQARGLQQTLRAAEAEVDVFAIDPGLMVDTDLAREVPWPLRALFKAVGACLTPLVPGMRTSKQSAAVIAGLVDDPSWNGRGFAYLDGPDVSSPSADALRDDLVGEVRSDADALLYPASA